MNVRWDAMDAKVTKTSVAIAYGEVVRVRRPGAGVKFMRSKRFLWAMVARKPVTRTITYKSLKPLRGEGRSVLR